MTRFMLPLLLVLVVGSPAWGGTKNISLHCNGDAYIDLKEGKPGERKAAAVTVLMAWNGAWIEIWGERVKRTTGQTRDSEWQYVRKKHNLVIHFTVAEMKFFTSSKVEGRNAYHYFYCFPFTHPFKDR
jgi:hypothetical protein